MEHPLFTSLISDAAFRLLLLRWARLQLAQDPNPSHPFSQQGSPMPSLRACQSKLCEIMIGHLTHHYRYAMQAAPDAVQYLTQAFYRSQNPFALREMSLTEAMGRAKF